MGSNHLQPQVKTVHDLFQQRSMSGLVGEQRQKDPGQNRDREKFHKHDSGASALLPKSAGLILSAAASEENFRPAAKEEAQPALKPVDS